MKKAINIKKFAFCCITTWPSSHVIWFLRDLQVQEWYFKRYSQHITQYIPRFKGWLHLRKNPQRSPVIPLKSVLTHFLNITNSSPKIHYQLLGTKQHKEFYCTSHYPIVSQSTDLLCIPSEVSAVEDMWQKWENKPSILIIGMWSFCSDEAGGHNCDF